MPENQYDIQQEIEIGIALADKMLRRRKLVTLFIFFLGFSLLAVVGFLEYGNYQEASVNSTSTSFMNQTATKRSVQTATAIFQSTATAQQKLSQTEIAINMGTATAASVKTATVASIQTATSVVYRNELVDWNMFFDRFDNNENGYWDEGQRSSNLWAGYQQIEDVYLWDVVSVNKLGVISYDWLPLDFGEKYYFQVSGRLVKGDLDTSCYGMAFGKSSEGMDHFVFKVCDNQTLQVKYYSEKDGWDLLTDFATSSAIESGEMNKIAVRVDGDEAVFLVNGSQVFEMKDTRLDGGSPGIMISNGSQPSTYEFDDFVVRWPKE